MLIRNVVIFGEQTDQLYWCGVSGTFSTMNSE